MVLTAITVSIAFIPLGRLNFPVALSIAILKATLVVLFFMHVEVQQPAHEADLRNRILLSPGSFRPDLVRLSVARLVYGTRWDDRRRHAGQNRPNGGARRALNKHPLTFDKIAA